jgi:hypothetical protein
MVLLVRVRVTVMMWVRVTAKVGLDLRLSLDRVKPRVRVTVGGRA